MSLDPEPIVAQWQQRSVSSAGLCCAVRPRPVLHAAPPSWSCRRYRLPGRAQPRQQPHGTDAHGQPVWESCHGGRNQWLRSQRWPWSQVLKHRCAAHEGQRTQRSHLLGHMMTRPPSTLLFLPERWEAANKQGKKGGLVLLLFSFFFNSLSASTNDNTGQTNTGATVKIREAICGGRHSRDNSCDCEKQQTLNECELHKCVQILRTSIGYCSHCSLLPRSQVSLKHEVRLD